MTGCVAAGATIHTTNGLNLLVTPRKIPAPPARANGNGATTTIPDRAPAFAAAAASTPNLSSQPYGTAPTAPLVGAAPAGKCPFH